MTDNEIIKALKCCLLSNEQHEERCDDCALNETTSVICQNLLAYHALCLINRQKAEIDRLKKLHELSSWDLPPMGGFHDVGF